MSNATLVSTATLPRMTALVWNDSSAHGHTHPKREADCADQHSAECDQLFLLPLCVRVAAIELNAEILSALQPAGLGTHKVHHAHLNSEIADGLQQSLSLCGSAASVL